MVLKHRNEPNFGTLGFSRTGNTMSTSAWHGDLTEMLELDEQLKLAQNTVVPRLRNLVTSPEASRHLGSEALKAPLALSSPHHRLCL